MQAARGFAQTDPSKCKQFPNPGIYKINYRVEVPVTAVAAALPCSISLSGILVPGLHKMKPGKTPHLTILPFGGYGADFTAIYRM